MLFIIGVVFGGVFLVLTLLLLAGSAGSASDTKQTLAHLQTALSTNAPLARGDQDLDVRKNERLSTIPMFHTWLEKLELAPRLRVLLHQANLNLTAGTLLMMVAACFLIPTYLIYLRTQGVLFSLAFGLAFACLPILYVRHRRAKRFDQFEQALPDALDLMVSGLRAGHSLVAALRLVAQESPDPIGSEFRICFEEQNYGLELRAALENLITRIPLQDLRIMSTAILIQKESGGNLAEVLDKTSAVIRERFKLKRQVRVHTAQGRLTGWILSALPLVLGCALYMIDPKTMSILWTRAIGIKLLYASAVMTMIGAFIINKIVNMDV